MKLVKSADLLIQAAIAVSGIIYVITGTNTAENLVYLYFIMGGWQLLGFIVHLFLVENWISLTERKQYGQTLFWMLILGLVSYFTPLFLFYLMGLLIVSPVLATWYFMIGISEWKRIKQRELIHLK